MVDYINLKNSQTALSDLYNYVQMGEKNNQESKNNENHALIIKISMKMLLIGVTTIILVQQSMEVIFKVFTFLKH